MSKLSIYGENEPSSHNKVSNVYKVLLSDAPIRLKNTSRLRKLGENGNRLCQDCRQSKCTCLWSKINANILKDQQHITRWKQLQQKEQEEEHCLMRGWNVGNTLLHKFRLDYDQYKSNLLAQQVNDSDSVVWILKPTKPLRISKTNIHWPMEQMILPKYTTGVKYTHGRTVALNSKSMRYNARTGTRNATVDIAKITKDYFNERRRKLTEIINEYGKKKKSEGENKKSMPKASHIRLPNHFSGLLSNKSTAINQSQITEMLPQNNQREDHLENRQTRSWQKKTATHDIHEILSYNKSKHMFDDTIQRSHSKLCGMHSIDSLENAEFKSTHTLVPASSIYSAYIKKKCKVTERDMQTQTSNPYISACCRSTQIFQLYDETTCHTQTVNEIDTKSNLEEQFSCNAQTVCDSSEYTLNTAREETISEVPHNGNTSYTTCKSLADKSNTHIDDKYYNDTSQTIFVSLRDNSSCQLQQCYSTTRNWNNSKLSIKDVETKVNECVEKQYCCYKKLSSWNNAKANLNSHVEEQCENKLMKEKVRPSSPNGKEKIKCKITVRKAIVKSSVLLNKSRYALNAKTPTDSSKTSKPNATNELSRSDVKKLKALRKTARSQKCKLIKKKSQLRSRKGKRNNIKIRRTAKVSGHQKRQPVEQLLHVQNYNVIDNVVTEKKTEIDLRAHMQETKNAKKALKNKTTKTIKQNSQATEKVHHVECMMADAKNNQANIELQPPSVEKMYTCPLSNLKSVVSILPHADCSISFHTPMNLQILKGRIKYR